MITTELTAEQQSLIGHLELWKKMHSQMEVWDKHNFAYKGMHHFLLEHGQWYEPTPWNSKYPTGVPKECFGNAVYFGQRKRWRYVEGFVVVKGLEFLPIHHGWNLDASGKLIDTTLRNEGTLYFGVEFSVARANDAINRHMAVLDDYAAGHPILREPWQGEDFSRVWTRKRPRP